MRLIDADVLISCITNRIPYAIDTKEDVAFASGLDAAYLCVKDAPSIDAEPVRHGRWAGGVNGRCGHYCSECSERRVLGQIANYCPSCGTKMDAPERAEGSEQ